MDLLPIGLGALALVAIAAFVASSSSSDDQGSTAAPVPSSSSSIDISIPYDAPARLAYKNAKGVEPKDDADFAAFKAEYEKKAVEEVIAKKKVKA